MRNVTSPGGDETPPVYIPPRFDRTDLARSRRCHASSSRRGLKAADDISARCDHGTNLRGLLFLGEQDRAGLVDGLSALRDCYDMRGISHRLRDYGGGGRSGRGLDPADR